MGSELLPYLVAWACLGLGPGWLTAVGAGRRGHGASAAVLLGLVFPLTWTLWYVADRPAGRRQPHGIGRPG